MRKNTSCEKDDAGVRESNIEEKHSSVSKEECSTPVEEADSNMSEGEQQIVEEQQTHEANQLTTANTSMSQLSCKREKCLQEIVREQEEQDQLVTGVREELDFQKKQLSMLTDHTKPIPLPPIRVSQS